MPIPDYQAIMLPFLKLISDGKEYQYREVVDELANHFKLTENERKELLPSGSQFIFSNRVGWARTYLKKAGLVEASRRGAFKITQKGMDVLKKNPSEITVKFLEQFPEFVEFKNINRKQSEIETPSKEYETEQTPEESLEFAHQKLRQNLAQDLIEKIKSCSPAFFERLVIDLLIKMGYGGSRKDAGEAIGKSGDGGIDGIIKEDKLGLDIIYIQAKRWENQVPVKEIRDFAGSLLGKKAKKGIFITTSAFPESAYKFVEGIEHKIILIDGARLAELMIEHNIGTSTQNIYEVKKVDSDYFTED